MKKTIPCLDDMVWKKTVRFSIEPEIISNNYVDDDIPNGKNFINLIFLNFFGLFTWTFDNFKKK